MLDRVNVILLCALGFFTLGELRVILPPAHRYPSEVEHSIGEAPFP